MENNDTKEVKEFKILYDWLQIARKETQTLRDDIRMVMQLIKVPVSHEEVNFLMKIIDPLN